MRFREFGQGVYPRSRLRPLSGSNISHTGTATARRQRRLGIEPGTSDWFRLWFRLPYLTGEPAVK